MSHDTQHGHATENKAIISFGNSFWLVVILVGLFIAAINFVQVESAAEGHEGGHHTEAAHGGHAPAAHHEAAAPAAHEEAMPAHEAASEEATEAEGETEHHEGH
jgi:hypothetical protein